jgi:hypothetical protein
MTSLIILAAIAGVTILAAFLWRVNSMLLFTSVAVGDLLVRHLGNDASLVVGSSYRGANSDIIAKIGLLFLPVVLTLLFGRHSLSKSKAFLHLIPIIATGGVLALLTLLLLPAGFQGSVYNSPAGTTIKEVQDLAIAAAGVASLLVAWLTNSTQKAQRGKKH